MTVKTRRILFYILFFLFIFIGLTAVFYSYGWRISAENCSIAELPNCFQKTGGLFIETEPKEVVIKIDDKTFKDKSGIIQNGTLIKNLPPKTYKIKIEKNGFLPYEKKVRVESNLVAEIPNVILIPEKLEKTPLPVSKPIDSFWMFSQQKIIFKNNGALYHLPSLSKLKGNQFVGFSEDGGKIIVSASDGKNSTSRIYYLYELNDFSKSVNISAIFKNLKKGAVIDEVAFHPADSNRLIVKGGGEDGRLYFLDLNRLKLETVAEKPVLAWTVKNPNIYYIRPTTSDQQQTTNGYILASFNLILKTESVISQFPNFPISQFLNSPIILSPDNKKIAFFDESGGVNIYFLQDYRFGINKKAGDTINLNLYKGKEIKNIFWHKDSYHLFVEYGENIDFIEIDDRTPVNKYALIEKAADFYYDLKSNIIYFLADKDKTIYYSAINGD